MDAEIDIIDAEIKRLKLSKERREKASERLKNNITQAMNLFLIDEIKTPLVKINFRNSETVEVENTNNLPDKYIVRKVTETADKMAIKKAIKDGEVIRGCSIIAHRHLQIR